MASQHRPTTSIHSPSNPLGVSSLRISYCFGQSQHRLGIGACEARPIRDLGAVMISFVEMLGGYGTALVNGVKGFIQLQLMITEYNRIAGHVSTKQACDERPTARSIIAVQVRSWTSSSPRVRGKERTFVTLRLRFRVFTRKVQASFSPRVSF